MAKISELTDAGTLDGTELVPVVKGNAVRKATLAILMASAALPSITLARQWAEGTVPGGAGTKSAREWSHEATAASVAAGMARDVALATGVEYQSAAAAAAVLSDGQFASYFAANGRPVYGRKAGGTMSPIAAPWFNADKIAGLAVNVLERGLTNDGSDCQAAMTALMHDETAKVIRFPPGLYSAYLNNSVSGRVFIFEEGAIIDGTIHIAVGTGPDTHGVPTIRWVDNTYVIGTLTSTVRVGAFYCRGLVIPKVRITEISASYANQTAEGGSNGTHFYCGCKDLTIGEIICDSATDGVYALGVDRNVTNDADHRPENIRIGRLIVRKNTQSIISTLSTVNLTIDEVIADSWDSYGAMTLTNDENLWIGRIKIKGAPTAANRDGIYVLNGISASFGEIDVSGATQIGFRTFNCGWVDVGTLRARGNALDQVRLESPGYVDRIETRGGGSGVAVLIQGNAAGLEVGRINDNGGGGITVTAADVIVPRIIGRNNLAAGKYGLNVTGARFVNDYLKVDANAQGLRMVNAVDPTFGNMLITNNTNGIIGSNVTGLAYRSVSYSGNGTDTNIQLNTVPGFRGSLVRQSVASIGDADIALTVGTSAVGQVCATSLTANRTITLPTTSVRNGDRFRISRTAASGGVGNLAVAGIGGLGTVNLATGQWLEVEYVSGWQMTARGSLFVPARGSAAYDPPSIAPGTAVSTTISVIGALVGDVVLAAFSLPIGGLMISAQVSSTNFVTVTLFNPTSAPVDLANGTLSATVLK